jgi:plastocyanin
MKKTFTFICLAILFTAFHSKATTVIIQAIGTSSSNEIFSPEVATAECGDTIRWVLVSGTHTTASTTIPQGATPWVSGNITVSGYIYVVTVPGTYNYTCHPQTGGHMEASIVVTCTSGVPSVSNENMSSVFPNPSNGNLTVDIKDVTNCSFEIFNVSGERIFQSQLTSPVTETDLNIPNGIYYYELKSETKLIGKGRLVIQK